LIDVNKNIDSIGIIYRFGLSLSDRWVVALGHPPLIIMEIDMDIVEWLRTYGSEPSRLNEAADEIERLRKIIVEHELWKEAPCCLCGYNGPNYFQPSIHKCAALQQKESE
jgi:hypothetical protein